MTITRGCLEQMYKDIEDSPSKPKFVIYQGVKYRTGSKPLKKALDKFYETLNAKPRTKSRRLLNT